MRGMYGSREWKEPGRTRRTNTETQKICDIETKPIDQTKYGVIKIGESLLRGLADLFAGLQGSLWEGELVGGQAGLAEE